MDAVRGADLIQRQKAGLPTIHCNWGNLNLYLDQPITKGMP